MWFTPVHIEQHRRSFDHSTSIFSIGSCFADEMGRRLTDLRFKTLTNPLGIAYNPVSMAQQIRYICRPSRWSAESVFEFDSKWRHDDIHSRLSATSREAFVSLVKEELQKSHAHIQRSSLFIITLGTAYGWRRKSNGLIVGNCHKQPGHLFDRELLDASVIREALEMIHTQLTDIQPSIELVVTVSPIRHLRDGIVDSQWSKSRLIDCCRTWAERHESVYYFPAYEIMMDELRDYRFYQADKIHPSEEAVNFIFDKFFQQYFYSIDKDIIRQINKINKLKGHRASSPTKQDRINEKIETLEQQLPL